jgi:large subunit ribosomal protein L15
MKLHDLHPKPGAHQPSRRVGRGHGSGRGKTAGRGTKGQRARAGGGIQPWFEGGQTPLHVRTPKLHGFKNRFRVEYAVVNLARLTGAQKGILITPDVLEHDGVIRDTSLPVEILGNGDAPAGVTIHAHAFSRSARQKLEAAGSTFQQIGWPDGQPVEAATASETDAGASAEPEPQPPALTPAQTESPAPDTTEETESE